MIPCHSSNMAELKTSKIVLPLEFSFQLNEGWDLSIDTNCYPVKYTLKHGKKSMTFNSDVIHKLCTRNYGIRLVRGRTQMIIPPHVLQSFVENSVFIEWYEQSFPQI